jgi:small subunit ribosomal protein S2
LIILGPNVFRVLLNNSPKNSFSSVAAIPQKIEIPQEQQIITNHINPLHHPDFFNVANLFTVRDLFEARVHFGHKEGSLDEKMKPYVYGSRLGHLIFDLDQTAENLRRALNVTAHVAFQGGIILFFCRNALNSHRVEAAAMECGEFAHTRYWRGGVFTNANIQFRAVTSKL